MIVKINDNYIETNEIMQISLLWENKSKFLLYFIITFKNVTTLVVNWDKKKYVESEEELESKIETIRANLAVVCNNNLKIHEFDNAINLIKIKPKIVSKNKIKERLAAKSAHINEYKK